MGRIFTPVSMSDGQITRLVRVVSVVSVERRPRHGIKFPNVMFICLCNAAKEVNKSDKTTNCLFHIGYNQYFTAYADLLNWVCIPLLEYTVKGPMSQGKMSKVDKSRQNRPNLRQVSQTFQKDAQT